MTSNILNMKKLLLILFISLGLIGCASNQMLDDGYFYKDIGGAECQSYQVVSPKRIKCFDSNGNFTYEQDAMTDHEVIAWKMDEQNAAIMSIQSHRCGITSIQVATIKETLINKTLTTCGGIIKAHLRAISRVYRRLNL